MVLYSRPSIVDHAVAEEPQFLYDSDQRGTFSESVFTNDIPIAQFPACVSTIGSDVVGGRLGWGRLPHAAIPVVLGSRRADTV